MKTRPGKVNVKGYREFMRAVSKCDKETRAVFHKRLREAGDIVRADAKARFEPYSAKSARGYRIRSRVRGVYIEQSLRKTTGLHPEYGAFQMRRALEPALAARESDVEKNVEKALDDLADLYEKGH